MRALKPSDIVANPTHAKPNLLWLWGLIPLGLTGYLLTLWQQIAAGEYPMWRWAWVPDLDIVLSFRLDGLSYLMSLLVLGVGGLILIYASGYMAGDPKIGRFFTILIIFMIAMLGVVTADNILLLFIFWELTSISSFLLIGFKHEKTKSQKSAQQALIVTGLGGLALMAGLVILGNIGGSWEFSELLKMKPETFTEHPWFLGAFVLIILGAFTKSAQFPFHFWLPNAMAAPTPVSAYLHSATMVKAGVYLLARVSPIMSGTEIWLWTLVIAGGMTGCLGGWLAWQQNDMKRIMAYTTISALGVLVFCLGIGGKIGAEAAVLFLLVHSLYKGALFMTAGSVDHETGTRDVTILGGLWREMPITFAAVVLATLSMAGIPPLIGFVGKEIIYEATVEAQSNAVLFTIIAFVMNFFNVAAGFLILIKPYLEPRPADSKVPHVHEAPWTMWLGPIALGVSAVLAFFFVGSEFFSGGIFSPAVSSVYGKPVDISLYAIPKTFNIVPQLSIATIVAGLGFYFIYNRAKPGSVRLSDAVTTYGPEQGYFNGLDGLLAGAKRITLLIQSGYMRRYVTYSIGTLIFLVIVALLTHVDTLQINARGTIRLYELIIFGVIIAAVGYMMIAKSRLAAVAALGVVGYGIALLFLYFNAPDIAMTQFSIETLSVILFILVLYRLPHFETITASGQRTMDAIFAIAVGTTIAIVLMLVTTVEQSTHVVDFYALSSYTEAKGRNVVNVILVDYRGFDTFIEICVLAVAAIGVHALIKRSGMSFSIGPKNGMIPSIIFMTATRYLVPIMLMFAVFILFRGHNEPGGGFVGGLLAASAFALYIFAFGVYEAEKLLGAHPLSLIAGGLAIAFGSTLWSPILFGLPLMTGVWTEWSLPAIGKLGTPLFFDIGVMLVVVGVILLIIFALAEEDERLHGGT